MSDKITTYKISIQTYIDTYNYSTTIEEFILNINKIIAKLCNDGKCTNITNFFRKSYYILLFHFYEYNPYKNGTLLGNSINSLYTIADFKLAIEEEKKSYFIKVIDYSTQYYQSLTDLVIIDIINAILFEKILLFDNYKQYRHFIPVYKGSTLSYKNSVKSTLNFNEIKSYYDGNNLLSNNIPNEDNQVILFICEAIKEPISVDTIFMNFYNEQNEINKNMVLHILRNVYDIYTFLIDIGINFGFMHNDLHFGNILYNSENNKLVLIDFGHTVFSKYIEMFINTETSSNIKDIKDIKDINDNLQRNFIKLNYDEILKCERPIPVNGNCITRFFYRDIFKYNSSIILRDNKYFGIIYDLMTFALNLLFRFLLFLNFTDKEKAIDFRKDIETIILIVIDGRHENELTHESLQTILFHYNLLKNFHSTDILFKNYECLKKKYLNGTLANNYIEGLEETEMKVIFKIILEGILYVALLLKTKNFTSNNIIFTAFQITIFDLDIFRDYINNEILSNETYTNILKDDYLFKHFINITTRGGFKNNTDILIPPLVNETTEYNYSTAKDMLYSNPTDITPQKQLEKTAIAYEKIYNDKAIIQEKFKSINSSLSSKTGGKKRILKSYNK